MEVRKLTSTEGWLAVDLPDAERSVGVVRLAPKVLKDGVELLARANTYSFAAFGVRAGGISAGINALPDDRDKAITAFCEEVAPDVGAGRFHFSAGPGVEPEELAPLGLEPLDVGLAVRGAAEAAAAFTGGGKAVVVGGADWAERLAPWWTDAGGVDVADGAVDADVDVLFVAGRPGIVGHEDAARVRARAVVPLTPVPVTAKAFAVLERAGVIFVPDAVSLAAPLLALVDPDGGDPVQRVAKRAEALTEAGPAAWRKMVTEAEEFLRTWQATLPYGRPLA